MAPITNVTASLLVLLDEILGIFATVEMTNAQAACGIGPVNATLTACGLTFMDALVDFTFAITKFTSSALLGLNVG